LTSRSDSNPSARDRPRQPFHFQVDGGELFAFAALWTRARIEGEWIASAAMLTCGVQGNPVAAAIHDRMPAILAEHDAQRAWLDRRWEQRTYSHCAGH
jgi:putative SOS response-associated peptidase YedK